MPVIINGSTGISGTDGSADTPALQGTDANTGIFFPATDVIAIAAGGVESLRLNNSGQAVHAAGTASLPAVTVTGDRNTGMYFPGADRIGFAEGGVQVGEFDASGNFLFNSGYGSVATAFGCRAWVNFGVSGGTPSINASGNISSITDNGAGDFTFNFSTNLPNTNYCIVGMGTGGGANYQIPGGNQGNGLVKNVGSVRMQFGYVSSIAGALANQDPVSGDVAIFR